MATGNDPELIASSSHPHLLFEDKNPVSWDVMASSLVEIMLQF